jgi:putative ABC transport system permease protein
MNRFTAMIKNFIKTALRSLLKNKGFTFINVFGLALGLATCLLIVFYVFDELSYDRYNTKYERIYRVNTDLKYNGVLTHFGTTAKPVAAALAREFPEVERSARISGALNIRFKKGNEIIREDEDNTTFYCDPGVFGIFTMPMLYGDPKTALAEPNSIVISESEAKKYFNRTNVVGRTLFLVTDSSTYKITGVMRDMPSQSHFRANFLMSMSQKTDNSWNSIGGFWTYILLRPGAGGKRFEAKLDGFMRRRLDGLPSFKYEQFARHGNYLRLNLMPLKDIHLHSNLQWQLGAGGNVQYIYIFSAIALFILLLACVNFMNLSTARSANRAREVGVRKVLGSSRKYLIAQFLSESIMLTLAAAIIAVLAAWALLPLFNQVSSKQLAITMQTFTWLLPALLVIIIVVGVLAGSYPAFFLSAFQPITVLKGKLSAGLKGGALRGFLVVFQFAISIFLIIGTFVIYNQLNYMQNKDIGYNRNQVLIVKNMTAIGDPKILKREIKQLPDVVDATLTSFLPTNSGALNNLISNDKGKDIFTAFWPVDEDYLQTMGMKLVKGRDFSREFATDTAAVIINETAAGMFGYTKDPLNQILSKKYHVIGVVKDFNFTSLRDNIGPLVMQMADDWHASLSVRVSTTNLPALMARIKETWRSQAPNEQFEYSFMDEDFNALYSNEQRMGKLFVIFTTLAIIIACLGLFGLAAYAAEQRTREIGIRKVLGANVAGLMAMLSKDFIKLILIAILIASPLAWLAMQKWLQGFAYRDGIHWWFLAVTAVGAILIAFVTISFQSFKAASANPVDSLRSE